MESVKWSTQRWCGTIVENDTLFDGAMEELTKVNELVPRMGRKVQVERCM